MTAEIVAIVEMNALRKTRASRGGGCASPNRVFVYIFVRSKGAKLSARMADPLTNEEAIGSMTVL